VALALSRQGVPALKREAPFRPEDVWKGAYVVREAPGASRVVLLASGSEVSLACDAATRLGADGIAARVVSVPSLELLAAQPADYRRSLLPDDALAVAVEAGRAESFRALVGRSGLVYGLDRFGASAPWQQLAEHFGFTPEQLCAAVLQQLGRGR